MTKSFLLGTDILLLRHAPVICHVGYRTQAIAMIDF
jgi:hypothetical protein